MPDELHGYKPVYEKAVQTILDADPKVLSAVHELLFSGYAPLPCENPEKGCVGNWQAAYRFSGLLKSAIYRRRAA